MTQYWEPGTQYNDGDVVEYEGHRYKIIQPHRSQSDWAPPITPALWGQLQDGDNGGRDQQHASHQQPQGQAQQSWQPDHKGEPSKEEEKHWYDLDEKRKKELEIGGGVLAGAAVIAGAGYALHNRHEKEKEQGHNQQPPQGSGQGEHWYDVDDKRKKQLEIGAGVAAGAGLLAAGFGLYKHHEKEKAERNDD